MRGGGLGFGVPQKINCVGVWGKAWGFAAT